MNCLFYIRILVVMLIVLPGVADGQEFWLRPDRIQYKAGDSLKIAFITGENFNGRRWPLTKEEIKRFEIHQATMVFDLKPGVNSAAKFPATIPPQGEGTKLILMQTEEISLEKDAGKFNAALKEDGLEEIISQRSKGGTTNDPVRERLTCYTKLLVQVGEKKDDTFKNVVGFPIEIIPDKNPSLLKKGDVLHFKILYLGKPLFGAKVRIWNYYDHLTTTQNIFTQQDGTIEMTISGAGSWLVNVVKMTPLNDGNAEWVSHKSSLAFGIK